MPRRYCSLAHSSAGQASCRTAVRWRPLAGQDAHARLRVHVEVAGRVQLDPVRAVAAPALRGDGPADEQLAAVSEPAPSGGEGGRGVGHVLEGVVEHDQVEHTVHVVESCPEHDDAVLVAEVGVHERVDAQEVAEPVVVEREQRLAGARPYVQDPGAPVQPGVADAAQDGGIAAARGHQGADGVEAIEGMVSEAAAEPASERRGGVRSLEGVVGRRVVGGQVGGDVADL
jgi:hypothetical protein